METLQRLHNRGSIPTGYNIDNSCKFEHDNAESLSRAQAQGSQQTWTFSTWIKRTQLSENSNEPYQNIWSAGSSTSNATHVYFRGDSSYSGNQMFFYMDNGGSQFWHGRTPQVFRDTSAWYHLVWAVDTTQATASNRSKIYINGVQITLDNVTYPNQNANTRVMDNGGDMYIGALAGNGGYRFNGYLAETVLIDGSQLAATDFGEFDDDSGIWKPIDVSELSFGTRGFYLDYSDAANLGNDADGSTVFTENYLTAADQATDTPTNNFATLNPIHVYSNSALPTISHGATKLTTTNSGWWTTAVANMAITSGKWYFEARSATSNTHLSAIGYGDEADIENWGIDRNANRQCHVGRTHSGGVQTKSYAYIGSDTEGASYGRIFPNGTSPSTRVNYIYTDVIGVAIDADNGYAYWHKNGTYINSGDPTSGANGTGGYAVPSGTGTNGTLLPAIGAYYHAAVGVIEVNFGGYTEMSISSAASDANGYGTFEYAPPSGYYALCTKNLEEYG